jgi:raffinose/stachyose/melibiose transport system permease protein
MLETGYSKWTSRILFMSPAVIVYGMMVLIPIALSFYYSFFDWNGVSPRVFSGLHNWIRLLSDEPVRLALIHSFQLTFWALVIQLPIALLLALLLQTKIRGSNFFKTIYFFPVMMSSAVLGIMWGQIYDPNIGIINTFLSKVGLDSWAHVWLGEEKYALAAIIAVVAWQYIGFYVVIFFGALQGIPDDLVESATIEGASPWQLLVFIRMPLIRHVISFTILNCVINSLRYFDLVYIMTQGGPNNSSEVMASYIFKQAFQFLDFGYGSAVSALLFIISLLLAIVLGRLMRSEQYQF